MAPILDSSVSELYRDYKSSTNFAVQWLYCQVKAEDPSTEKFTSIHEILAAAKVVKKAQSIVPKSVLASLRTAIAKRKQVYDIYEKNGAGCYGHAAFAQRLESTLTILSSLQTAPATSSSSRIDEPQKRATAPNAFAPLAATVEDVDDDDEIDVVDHTCASDTHGEAPSSAHTAPNPDEGDFILEDDAIRQFHESINFLLELSKVYSQLEGYWRDAAAGKLPLPLAAWLTSLTAHTIAKDAPRSFFNLCESVSSPCNTCPDCPGVRAFVAKMSPSPAAAAESIAHGTRIHTIAKAINAYGAELTDMSTPSLIDVCPDKCVCRVRTDGGAAEPHDQDHGPRLPETDEAHLREILGLIRADVLGTRGITPLERIKKYAVEDDRVYQSEPLCCFAQALFFSEEHVTPGRLIFAMDFFLLAAESASVTEGSLSYENCQARPRRLALDMRSAVDPVIEFLQSMNLFADWGQTVGYLEQFRDALNVFAGECALDKYHGSPWTAGNQLTELLMQASLVGANVSWDWAIINSTLHLYNAMRQVGILRVKKIPLLDELAEVLIQDTFRGALPDRNFASTFSRIVFNSGIDKTRGRVQYGFGSKPLRGQHITWFLHQHREAHFEGLDWLGEVYGVATCTKQRCSRCRKDPKKDRGIREAHLAGTLPGYMEKAKTKVLPELEGNAPIARLNFFGLFMFCAQFMRRFGELSEAELGKPFKAADSPRELWAHPLHLARFATELVLDSIDEGFGSRESRRLLKKKKLVENAGQAFKELDAEASLGQFTWAI
ncbi:hypothetical protein K4K61_000163 [Colletotrichum sp. SAR11_59]|nr:hypothetical protein K4K61_000163 [Colletotrichum sp. SAR11_59]